MRKLDPMQLPFVGPCLVEASAGTGKTYTITTLVLRLLLEKRLSLGEILIVTYTRAATAELRSRVRTRIAQLHHALSSDTPPEDPVLAHFWSQSRAEERLAEDQALAHRALLDCEEASIFTIHGVCQRLLSDFAFETDTPFDLGLMPHSEALVAEVVRDYWTQATQHIEPAVYARLRSAGSRELTDLVLQTLSGPLPNRDPVSDLVEQPDPARWHEAKAALAMAFEAGRDSFIETMKASKLSWGDKSLIKPLDAIQSVVESDAPGLSDTTIELLERLTTGTLKRAHDRGKPLPEHPVLTALWAFMDAEAQVQRWLASELRKLHWGGVLYARSELERRTRERGEATFDQLLTRTHAALTGPRGAQLVDALQRRYRAALIDEFQDTDPMQYEIFARGFRGLPLLLIGDPKQAIYGFRGADVFAYLQARERVGSEVFTLGTNFRSDPGVVVGLNHLYANCPRPFALPDITYHPVAPRPGARDLRENFGGAPVELLWMQTEQKHKPAQLAELCERIATDVVGKLRGAARIAGRPLRAGDIAVLCRTNKQAHSMQQALAERGVPCLLQGDSSVFETPDALEVERVLAALADPTDGRVLRVALAGSYFGLSASAIDALADDGAWDAHRARLSAAHRTWSQRGFVQAIRQYLRDYEVEGRLMVRPDGARRWTNLEHLIELLQQAHSHEGLGPDGLLRWLRTMRTDVATRKELLGESTQIRLESLADAVRLTTVHRSKGLEYPVVYCPFAWIAPPGVRGYPLVHPEDDPTTRVLDLGSEREAERKTRAEEEALSDELRVLYVALTRAKHALCVIAGGLKDIQKSGLAHLLGTKALAVDEARDHLERLAQASDGTVGLRDLPLPSPTRLPKNTRSFVEARARKAPRVEDTEQVTSFTALSHRSYEATLGDAGIDRDAVEPNALATQRSGSRSSGEPLPLADFPRGAAAGVVVHALLEDCDFADDAQALSDRARTLLPERGMAADFADALGGAMHQVLRTPLADAGARLCDVASDCRIAEMEFNLRLEPKGALSPKDIADLLRTHAAPAALPAYADQLQRLDFATLGGLLRGYIDLVFQSDGRFFVVDYKSNDLGADAEAYAPDRLAQAMAAHHYYLQYLLYTVAVHRYLRLRIADYSYEAHFGGAYYLFLRGMSPERGERTGVFFERPAPALVHDLDALLGAHDRQVLR